MYAQKKSLGGNVSNHINSDYPLLMFLFFVFSNCLLETCYFSSIRKSVFVLFPFILFFFLTRKIISKTKTLQINFFKRWCLNPDHLSWRTLTLVLATHTFFPNINLHILTLRKPSPLPPTSPYLFLPTFLPPSQDSSWASHIKTLGSLWSLSLEQWEFWLNRIQS